MSTPRILFYVQYLLGIGHVRRASLVVQALAQQGAQVDVVFGGMPVDNMSFGSATMHQLPAIKSADADFSGLVKADGSPFSESDKKARAAQLIQLCEKCQPDLIVTETYPFGRRQMRFELTPLLNWVSQQKKRPVLVASIRDILQRRSPVREQECIDLINAHYQHVLVHGDESFYPLQKSFPPASKIADKLSYSGYVCPKLPDRITANSDRKRSFTQPAGKIIVSIGGGSVGKQILETALTLCQQHFAQQWQWLLITGPNMDSADKAHFKQQAQGVDNLQVTDLADNFLAQLSAADLSISMAGYNTIMDLLVTGTPAVVIPFEGSGETEQLSRAIELEQRAVVQVISEDKLNPESLAQAMQQAIEQTPQVLPIDNQGAPHSAQQLIGWALDANNQQNIASSTPSSTQRDI